MFKSLSSVWGLLFIVSLTAGAQTKQGSTAAPRKWTLQECVDYAYSHNIQLKQSELTANTNENVFLQSLWNAAPTLNGSSSLSYSAGGRSVNPYTNTVVSGQTFRSSNMNLNLGLTIFNGLQNTNGIRRNQATLEASRQDILDRRNTTALNLVQAYVNILAAKEQKEAAVLQLSTTTAQIDRTKKLVSAGAAAQATLLTLQAQAATEEVNIINYDNNLELAKLNLMQIMQKPADEPFDISAPQIDPPADYAPLTAASQDIYSYAEEHQPVIKASELRIKSSRFAAEVAYGALLPSLTVSAGYYTSYSSLGTSTTIDQSKVVLSQTPTGYYGPVTPGVIPQPNVYSYTLDPSAYKTENINFNNQFNNNLRSGLTFNLNIPIFNGFSAQTNAQNAVINRKNAELNRDLAKNTLRQSIEQSYLNAKLGSKTYYATQKQVTALRESFRATDERFNVGAINSVDYQLAKNNLNKAEADLIRTKYDFLVKAKILDFYQGKDLSF